MHCKNEADFSEVNRFWLEKIKTEHKAKRKFEVDLGILDRKN